MNRIIAYIAFIALVIWILNRVEEGVKALRYRWWRHQQSWRNYNARRVRFGMRPVGWRRRLVVYTRLAPDAGPREMDQPE